MKIVGFGDFLIHFSPIDCERFLQAEMMRMSFTGAEANVCAALALWGESVQFVSKVPEHALAKKGLMFLNGLGVGTDGVQSGSGRMGLYFLEKGYSLRPSSVIYDRQHTLFAESVFEEYDWDSVLAGADAFYLSGITPSLSEPLFVCCQKLLPYVRAKGIPVFFDVNLRPTICDIHRSREIFAALSPYITNLIGNEEHLKQLLSLSPTESEADDRLYAFVKQVRETTAIGQVAVTVRRTHSASRAEVYAAYGNGESTAISGHRIIDVVDRVGSGDAFSAGTVYATLHGFSAKETVDFATAANALKHTVNNDILFATVEEIRGIMSQKSNDVKR